MFVGNIMGTLFAVEVVSVVGAVLLFLAKKVSSVALSKIEEYITSKIEERVTPKIKAFIWKKMENTALFRYFYPTENPAPKSSVTPEEKLDSSNPFYRAAEAEKEGEEQYRKTVAQFCPSPTTYAFNQSVGAQYEDLVAQFTRNAKGSSSP